MHTTLEEEIFYPAVREAIGDEDLMNEAAVEHETARMLIEQLENMGPDDPNYFATFTVLGEYVRHHIKEEQDEMFPAASKAGTRPGGARRAHARAQGRARVEDLDRQAVARRSASGSTSVKVLPSPGPLASRSSPPSSRVSSRLIDRPRPVPPYLRLVLPSACWNASKISCCLSGGMPMPVSLTANATLPGRLAARCAASRRPAA